MGFGIHSKRRGDVDDVLGKLDLLLDRRHHGGHDEGFDGQVAGFVLIGNIDDQRVDQAFIVGGD